MVKFRNSAAALGFALADRIERMRRDGVSVEKIIDQVAAEIAFDPAFAAKPGDAFTEEDYREMARFLVCGSEQDKAALLLHMQAKGHGGPILMPDKNTGFDAARITACGKWWAQALDEMWQKSKDAGHLPQDAQLALLWQVPRMLMHLGAPKAQILQFVGDALNNNGELP